MRDVTICFAYYRNLGVLQEQLKRLRALPADLRAHLALSVCDDGSAICQSDEKTLPKTARAAIWEHIGLPYVLSRIDVNVRWNQDAARNIAVHRAATEWLLITDADHIPPERTLRALVEQDAIPVVLSSSGKKEETKHVIGDAEKISVKKVYAFARYTLWFNKEGKDHLTPYHSHPNSWFMTKAMYDRLGGYDETFAGYYGTDADFRDRVRALVGEPIRLALPIYRVPRETIPDASTTSYTRKDKTLDADLKDMIRKRDKTQGWQTKRLSFPWTIVA